jgi:hypothetical protein
MKEKCKAPEVTKWSVAVEVNAQGEEVEKKNKKKKEHTLLIL